MNMASRDMKNLEKYVIVGGGVSGISAAETLRQSGFTGEILVLSNESYLPYDRTVLSKGVTGAHPSKATLRSQEFMDKHGITFKLDCGVRSLDNDAKKIYTNHGEAVTYDKLLITSGCRSNIPKIAGTEMSNVFALNEFKDVLDIQKKIGSVEGKKHVVICGAGFVGNEAAFGFKSSLEDNVQVTVVHRSDVYSK